MLGILFGGKLCPDTILSHYLAGGLLLMQFITSELHSFFIITRSRA